jgi:hypothetical protein
MSTGRQNENEKDIGKKLEISKTLRSSVKVDFD